MSFALFTDCSANLPGRLLAEMDIRVLPCVYTVDGVNVEYDGNIENFDPHSYYGMLQSGKTITTTLLNPQLFMDHFRPALEQGLDVIYVGLSSGVSGTFQASRMAAAQLQEEFPDRTVRMVDSLGAGLGTGLLTLRGADLRKEGRSADETADLLERERMDLCEFFIVGDLSFLHRTGRVSAATALLGNALNIKPILRGDETGHIVSCAKPRGRKKAIDALVERYQTRAVDPRNCRVAISHGDCPEDAQLLAERICAIAPPKELILCPHEPFTGAHVGPGMLALFFFGEGR